MTEIEYPAVSLKPYLSLHQVFRLAVAILMTGSLVACAVTPTDSATSTSTQVVSNTGLDGAADMYNSQKYAEAIRGFDKVTTDETASANDRRLAHLGKALVYLGNDDNWHSIENAKMSLVSAGQVAPDGSEEFSVETDLLMDAVSAVIGTESKYIVLQSKSGSSGAQVTELKRELDTLKTEREELLAEQKALNEALEKLKELTLGS